jgi:segregation and condensation protein B
MNEFYTRNVLEAALLAAGKPLQIAELGQLFDENTRPKVDDIRATLEALAAEYSNRGLEVKETAAGFRIQVRREFASEISRLWPERPARYSRALLETLALIAYRQPITRAEIEAVRGVAVNPNIVKTVIERNWVRVVGHRDVPGRPELLGTTREFLDYFGLRSLDELPPLAELKAMGDYNLQLELPNAGALGVEKVDGDVEVEGTDGVAVAVAGLLTSDVVIEGEGAAAGVAGGDTVEAVGEVTAVGHAGEEGGSDAVADANGARDEAAHNAVASSADGGEGDAAHDSVADAAGKHDERTHNAAVQSNGDASDSAHDPVADATGEHDEGTHDAVVQAGGDASDSAHDAVADAAGEHDEGAHDAAVQANGDASDSALDAVADAAGVHDEGAHRTAAQADSGASDGSRDAVADAASVHDAVPVAASGSEGAQDAVADGAHDDSEADRTLTSGNVSKHAADSDEADTSDSAISSESLDALDDAADDDSDEDELSADGHGSRELVAAPRDIDD